MNHSARQRQLRSGLERKGFDALLVTHMPNIRYLCGFTGSSGVLLVTRRSPAVLFTDGRYTEQARQEVKAARINISKKGALAAAADEVQRRNIGEIAVEPEHMTLAAYSSVRRTLRSTARIRKLPGAVERLRMVKDADEIAVLRAAVQLSARVFDQTLNWLRPGTAEASVAGRMELAMREEGAESESFETIVAGGPRSALPHGRASRTPLPRRGFVVIDHGAILHGYCSDQTRTVYLGKPDTFARRIYTTVQEAQQAAVDAVRPGRSMSDVDAAARRLIEGAGFGKYFTHSTGHGVGLEIHEAPRIASGVRERLAPGMVVTIEPGIYVPGRGGVRVEDMVLVTEDGCEVLTPTTKELIAL